MKLSDMQIKITENEDKAVKAASAILKQQFPIEKVVLFGSKARGDSDDESDIDLLLLTNRPVSWKERRAIIDALYDIEISYDVILSPLISTKEDWEQGFFSVMPVHDEIIEQGVAV